MKRQQDNKEKNALKNFVESSKPTTINREAVHQTAPTAAPKIHLLMRRCLIRRKVACTRSNEMAERLLTEASTRDLPNWPKCLYLKGLVNISLLFLVLLQAYPVINRASDVNNVAFVYFLVDHDNIRPIMRHFPICLNGKIPKNFSLVIR